MQKDAVLSRLRSLFEAVADEASRNPTFFARIESVLLSPEAVVATQQKPSSFARVPTLNVLEILHRDGVAAATEALGKLTNDELAKLTVADGTKKPKEAKSMDRAALIDLLIQTAGNRLRQGESFTKKPTIPEEPQVRNDG
jgi:hypothetical protein